MHTFSQKIHYFPPFIRNRTRHVFGMPGNGNRLRANIYLFRLIVGILFDVRLYRVRLSINSVDSLAESIVLLPVPS